VNRHATNSTNGGAGVSPVRGERMNTRAALPAAKVNYVYRSGKIPLRQRRRGAAAVSMLVALILISLIIIGLVLGGARDHDLTVRRVQTVQSFYAAEAGMNMAVRELMLDSDEDGDGTVGTISDDDDQSNDPAFGSARVFVEQSVASGDTILTSHGRSGESSRQLTATLTGSATTMGLAASYYVESCCLATLDDIDWTRTPDDTGTVTLLNNESTNGSMWPGGPDDYFGCEYTGEIEIEQAGSWTFYTESDDGSQLWINGQLIVDNDGTHGMQTRSGSITLTAGKHEFMVRYFEDSGGAGLIVSWEGPGVPGQAVIPASAYSH